MKVVITGGGTGGHIYPALAIIDELKKQYDNVEILYIGTKNRMESTLIPSLGIEYVGIEMQGIDRKKLHRNFPLILMLIKNYFILKKLYKNFKPDVVIGTGGYVTVPVIYSAAKSNFKTLIFDADKHFGYATRKLQKHANIVCSAYKQKDDNVIYSGNPRSQYLYENVVRSSNPYKVLFVFGSLGSSTINKFFKEYFNNKILNDKVKYVTGKGHYEEFVNGLDNSMVEVVEYVDDIKVELSDVKYVVSRSGATFVSELESLAIPAIYIPSPYVANNEQIFNVEKLLEAEASLVINESDLTFESIDLLFDKMQNDYLVMANNLTKIRMVNASAIIVDKIKEMMVK